MLSPEIHAGLDVLADEWDDLADRTGASPFLRPGWFAAWADAFGAGGAQVVAVRRGARLAGVLPLLAKPPRRLVSPTNAHTPEFGVIAEDAEVAGAIVAVLRKSRTTSVDLSFLSGDDLIVGALDESPYSVMERTLAASPWIDTSPGWDRYWTGLPGKFRREATRRRRRLAETAGEVTVDWVRSADGLDALLDEGFAIEGSGWKEEEGTAIASRPETDRFYRAVARWAAERGWLRLGFLRAGGRAVAFDLNLEAAGRVYVLKGGYDVELRRCAPRTLLTLDTLRDAFSNPAIRSYEFLGAAEPYKLELTDRTRERLRVQAFAPAPLGVAQRFAWKHLRPAVRGARRGARAVTTRARFRRTA